MTERSRNITVGITALIGLIGLAGLLMLFGYVPAFAQNGYLIHAEFPHAGGLNVNSRVRLTGVDVGQVTQIQLQPAPNYGVRVTARINENIDLPLGTEATIDGPFIGGSAFLALQTPQVPEGKTLAFLPRDGSAVIEGSATDLAGQFVGELNKLLDEPVDQLRLARENFQRLSEEWVKVGENVNLLLTPRSPAEADATDAVGNITTLVARADQRLRDLEEVLDGINAWTHDPELISNVKRTAANAADLSEKLVAGTDKLTNLADSARGNLDALTKRYVAVADDLSKTVNEMRETIEQARTGEGTFGRFLNDPALYNNLNDAATRLGTTLDEAKLLIEKWRSEGLPVQF